MLLLGLLLLAACGEKEVAGPPPAEPEPEAIDVSALEGAQLFGFNYPLSLELDRGGFTAVEQEAIVKAFADTLESGATLSREEESRLPVIRDFVRLRGDLLEKGASAPGVKPEMLELLGRFMASMGAVPELQLDEAEMRQFYRGMRKGFNGPFLDSEREDIRGRAYAWAIKRKEGLAMAEADSQSVEERAFLENAKAQKGMNVTNSGIVYRIYEPGDQNKPSANAVVKVHYRGRLRSGFEFDSTAGKDAAIFALQGVVPGFSEAVRLLGEGGRLRAFIPPELAYGNSPPPGSQIPPGVVLVFDIKLVQILNQGD